DSENHLNNLKFGAHVNRAVEVLHRVETRVIAREEQFGRAKLLRIANEFDHLALVSHTAYYRRVIRETRWPNEVLADSSISSFIDGFEKSALAYVDVGFQSLNYLNSGEETGFPSAYKAVVASEALRGQFGKSSPDGLDARLLK